MSAEVKIILEEERYKELIAIEAALKDSDAVILKEWDRRKNKDNRVVWMFSTNEAFKKECQDLLAEANEAKQENERIENRFIEKLWEKLKIPHSIVQYPRHIIEDNCLSSIDGLNTIIQLQKDELKRAHEEIKRMRKRSIFGIFSNN